LVDGSKLEIRLSLESLHWLKNRVPVVRPTAHGNARPARRQGWCDGSGEGLPSRFSLKQRRGDRDPYQRPLGVGEATGWAGDGGLFSPILGDGVGVHRWSFGSRDTSYDGDEARGNFFGGWFGVEGFYLSWRQRRVANKMAVGKSIREAVKEVLF
jgi:hypothetical protein